MPSSMHVAYVCYFKTVEHEYICLTPLSHVYPEL